MWARSFPCAFRKKYDITGFEPARNVLPLTALCALDATLSTIEIVYKVYPEAAYDSLCHSIKLTNSVVQFLVDSNANVLNQVNEDGWNVLHFQAACGFASDEILGCLASKNPLPLLSQTKEGSTPLHIACEKLLPVEKVKFFIDNENAVLKIKNGNGQTPLHLACSNETSLEVIMFLVDLFPGALEMQDVYGYVPLHAACERPGASLEIVTFLVSKNELALTAKGSISIDASTETVECLVENPKVLAVKTNPADRGGFGRNPLHLASEEKGRADIVRFLILKNPTSLTVPDSFGDLPIHRACWYSDLETVEVLLESHPETLQSKNGENLTPFLKACMVENVPVVVYMIERHPNLLNIKGEEEGWSPLHLVCATGKKESIRVIIAKCPDAAKEVDKKGLCPLALYASRPDADMVMVQELIEIYPDGMKVVGDPAGNQLALSQDQMHSLIVNMTEQLRSSRSQVVDE